MTHAGELVLLKDVLLEGNYQRKGDQDDSLAEWAVPSRLDFRRAQRAGLFAGGDVREPEHGREPTPAVYDRADR